MAVAVETVALKKNGLVAGVPVSCAIPIWTETEVVIVYGRAAIAATYGVDYTVALDVPDTFGTFSFTPNASLIAKLVALIAADATETTEVVVRRVLDYKSDSSEAASKYTRYLSLEHDRTAGRFQQLQEAMYRVVTVAASEIGDPDEKVVIASLVAGHVLVADGDNPKLIRSDVVSIADIANAQEYATEVAEHAATVSAQTALALAAKVAAENAAGANLANADSRAAAILATIPASVNYVRAAGYALPGDLGDALYKKVASQPTHAGKFQSANGLWFENAEPVLSPRQFGVIGDGTGDQTVALQACCDAASALGRREIVVPPGMTIRITDTVTVPKNVSFIMMGDSAISYAGTRDRPALVLGERGAANQSRYCRYRVKVIASASPDWTTADYVGALFINQYFCEIDAPRTEGFKRGARALGSGSGFVYNTIRLGAMINNEVGLSCAAEMNGGINGWCNENLWLAGEFTVSTNINTASNRWGILFEVLSGTSTFDNNVFQKPCFELNGTFCTGGADGVCVGFVSARNNRVLLCRSEQASASGIEATCDANCYGNYFQTLSGDTSRMSRITEAAGAWGNVYDKAKEPVLNVAPAPVFVMPNLAKRAAPYDATQTSVRGCFLMAIGAGTILQATDTLVIGADHIEVPTSRAIGVRFAVDGVEYIRVRRKTLAGFPGRIMITPWDSSGNRITTATVKGSLQENYAWQNTSFGGVYRQGNERDGGEAVINIPAGTVTLDVLFDGGTVNMKLQGFEVAFLRPLSGRMAGATADRSPTFALLPQFGSSGEDRLLSDVVPASGTWLAGDIVWNKNPLSTEPIGWVCTVAGTPGTWVGFGVLP